MKKENFERSLKRKRKQIFVLMALLAVSASLLIFLPNAKTDPSCVADSNNPVVKDCKISLSHSGGYNPSEFTVNKGDVVRFLAKTAEPQHQHGITIDEYGVDVEIDAGPKDPPQVIEFNATKTGTFTIWCKPCLIGPYGDHKWLKGQLIVNEVKKW